MAQQAENTETGVETLKSPIDILKLLDRSNCRDCGERTCLAFATAVFNGQRSLSECTHLDPEVAAKYSGTMRQRQTVQAEAEEGLDALRKKAAEVDLEEAAERLGGTYKNGRLTVKVLGKDFRVHDDGSLSSDIHVNHWVAVPVLIYVIKGEGVPVTGEWVQFRDLEDGRERYPLFEQRAEQPARKVADAYTDLFSDMLEIFNGKRVENHLGSDISIVLWPLPKVPILFCYWKPEEGIDSEFRIFFDSTADKNLDAPTLFTLCAGMVQMFEKMARRHGFAV
ncbi:MAG: DUF3786 domain-containing protein [Desulfatibacillaceae bacterium]